MKKLGTLALTAALAGSLCVGAAAAEPTLISANTGYGLTISVNGQVLDTTGIPGVEGENLIPMRLVAESDHGFANWNAEENESWFQFDHNLITVEFGDNSVHVTNASGETTQVDMTAQVVNGVTFLPAEIINSLGEGYSAVAESGDGAQVTITTPNSDPLIQLAYSIVDETGMALTNKLSLSDIEDYYYIDTDNFEQIVAFTPMIVNSDSVIIGKLAADGDAQQAKADLQAYQDRMIASFEQYLPGPLELAKNGKIVENNGYLMLIISPDTDTAIQLFEEATGN